MGQKDQSAPELPWEPAQGLLGGLDECGAGSEGPEEQAWPQL